MKTIHRVIIAVLFPVCAAMAQSKQDTDTAKKLFEAATVYYNAKDYEKALYGYQDAYKAAPLPFILFNIAQCYRFLGRHQEARDAYAKYIQDDPKSEYKAEVEQKIKDMDAAIAEEKAKEEARLAEIAASQASSTQAASTQALAPIPPKGNKPPVWRSILLPGGLAAAGIGLTITSLTLRELAEDNPSPDKSTSLFRTFQSTFIVADVALLSAAGVAAYQLIIKREKATEKRLAGVP